MQETQQQTFNLFNIGINLLSLLYTRTGLHVTLQHTNEKKKNQCIWNNIWILTCMYMHFMIPCFGLTSEGALWLHRTNMLPWRQYFNWWKKKKKRKNKIAESQTWFVKVELKTLSQMAVVEKHRLVVERVERCCCSSVFLFTSTLWRSPSTDSRHFGPPVPSNWCRNKNKSYT